MSSERAIKIVVYSVRQFRDPYYQGFAAQVAFYFMMSVVPLFIVLSQFLGFFSISVELLYGYIDMYMAGDAAEMVKSLLAYSPPGGAGVALIVVALWAASKAQFALMRIANYTLGEGTGRGYFRERIRAVRTILVTIFTIVFALLILVYGELILKVVVSFIVRNSTVEYGLSKFWLILRWPVAMALYFLMVSYNYYVLPTKRMRFREVVPGSIFAALAMLGVTWFFKWYTEYIANYDIIYGSLSSVVALMFWFFLISWALGLGIVMNKSILESKGNQIDCTAKKIKNRK